MKTKWEDKADQKLYIFLTTEILQCLMKNIYILNLSVSFLIYKLPKRYIQRYKRKYLRWLQGETRKLHKISEDKNLMESMHRRISHTMRNLAWCAKSFGRLKWFRMVCKILHNHAKMLVVGFLPLVFFLASLIGLAIYCQAWKRLWSAPKLGFFMYLSFNLHCHGLHKILPHSLLVSMIKKLPKTPN